MGRLRNSAVVPAGMLAPSGLSDTPVNPDIQSTTRPAGTLLRPSPGYDSVRAGKNRFQGKGPTGGFRQSEFAEDIGGTGKVLSVVPGETSMIEASEWLPDAREGSVIIADRAFSPAIAGGLHEGYSTIADMGDRHPSRPLSHAWFRRLNPTSMLRNEYQQSPTLAMAMGAGLVYIVYLVGGEIERAYKRPRGIGTDVSSVPAAGARASGEVTGDAIDKIGEAGDKAVNAIEEAANKAVEAITDTAKSAKETATGE